MTRLKVTMASQRHAVLVAVGLPIQLSDANV
jgi:hypothetical protein